MLTKHHLLIATLKRTHPFFLSFNKTFYFISSSNRPFSSSPSCLNQTKPPSITQFSHSPLTFNTKYPITTHKFTESLIESLQEYIRGSDMLEKGQYAVAIREFQMALKFLPKSVTGDNAQHYQAEYQSLVKKLIQAHVMMNKSIKSFTQSYKDYLNESSLLRQLISTLLKIEESNFQPLQTQNPPQKLWQQLVRAFAFRQSKECFGKHVPIEKVKETKDLALKYIGLFLYEKIKARKNKQRESIYLDTCRELLKQTEQFEPSKIVKPLSLMACNLLAGDQFLQAEGLMSHCLSVLEQFYHQNPVYLKTDQEYIMCKLLIARVFEGVRRNEESKKIREEYEPLFDQKKFMIQELVQVPYREL